MRAIREMVNGLILYLPLIIAIALIICAVIYRNVTSECDARFWFMIWTAIGVAVVGTLAMFVYHHLKMNKINGDPKSDPRSQILLHAISNPAFLLILYVSAIALVAGGMAYYLATDRCDSWFFGLILAGISVFAVAYIMKVTNVNYIRALESHGIVETEPFDIIPEEQRQQLLEAMEMEEMDEMDELFGMESATMREMMTGAIPSREDFISM